MPNQQNGATVHIQVNSNGHGHHENVKEVPVFHPKGNYGQTSNAQSNNFCFFKFYIPF